MNEAAFLRWLAETYVTVRGARMNLRAQASRVSNCRTVERHEGDLDVHFERDGMESLLQRLKYSKKEAQAGRPLRHRIPIAGEQYTGTSTLRHAVKLYKHFRMGGERPMAHPTALPPPQPVRKARALPADWPIWPQPGEADVLQLARSAIPLVRYLHPDIIRAVVEDTAQHREEWSRALSARGINPEIYLWEGSPCVFPGVRRYAGSREVAAYRGHTSLGAEVLTDALCLDDNDYPKQLWSFVFQGVRFAKHGPEGYSLAHLADHKQHGNRASDEFECTSPSTPTRPLFGLYTSAANTVYVSRNLIRPTDFAGALRNLLMRRSQSLYGAFCRLLPAGFSIPAAASEEWELDRFTWAEPVGTSEHIQKFLAFRRAEVERLLSPQPAPAADR
ncbi:MAG: hypothetical protein ACJ8AT_01615 [Hyalangium sp.]|uniref:hypothetical protein n=1 Tax=Hyalangium sp. TaxID=2028555 RepID=UPI00389A864A